MLLEAAGAGKRASTGEGGALTGSTAAHVVIIAAVARRSFMRKIRMALDDRLIREVDAAAAALGTTRSAFTREARKLLLRGPLTHRTREGWSWLLCGALLFAIGFRAWVLGLTPPWSTIAI
jgi:hypothetical protein